MPGSERKSDMKKELSLWMGALVIIITFSLLFAPQKAIYAAVNDGTYDINYEMKEAGNDNTSIADGYFTKPATLTVTDGVKYIQLTVTSSSMIESLSAPSGPVEVVTEDKSNETRTVKFRVDGDLSQPVPMDMHIIVPDLYDMEHTARAVFDVSDLDTGSENEEGADSQADEATADDQEANKEDNNDTADNTVDNNSDDEELDASENNDNESNTDEENVEADNDKTDSSSSAESLSQNDENDASSSGASIYWISAVIAGLLIIAGIIFWITRKKNK